MAVSQGHGWPLANTHVIAIAGYTSLVLANNWLVIHWSLVTLLVIGRLVGSSVINTLVG